MFIQKYEKKKKKSSFMDPCSWARTAGELQLATKTVRSAPIVQRKQVT